MSYKKENNQYIYINGNGETIFSSPIIALLTNKGVVINHGPVNIMKQKYVQAMNGGSQYSLVESDSFDVGSLNKMVKDIPPTIQ